MSPDVAASIRARALRKAKSSGERFELFLVPVRESAIKGQSFTQQGSAGGPWQARTQVGGGSEGDV